jgi:hypothetical protein
MSAFFLTLSFSVFLTSFLVFFLCRIWCFIQQWFTLLHASYCLFFLAYSSTLRMEAKFSSEISVGFQTMLYPRGYKSVFHLISCFFFLSFCLISFSFALYLL